MKKQRKGLTYSSSDKQIVTCASLTLCEICPQLLVQLEGRVANGEIKELHQIMSKPHFKVSILHHPCTKGLKTTSHINFLLSETTAYCSDFNQYLETN